jgi:hypothetical protein
VKAGTPLKRGRLHQSPRFPYFKRLFENLGQNIIGKVVHKLIGGWRRYGSAVFKKAD